MSDSKVYVVEWGGTRKKKNSFGWIPSSAFTEFAKAHQERREMQQAHPDQLFRVKKYERASA